MGKQAGVRRVDQVGSLCAPRKCQAMGAAGAGKQRAAPATGTAAPAANLKAEGVAELPGAAGVLALPARLAAAESRSLSRPDCRVWQAPPVQAAPKKRTADSSTETERWHPVSQATESARTQSAGAQDPRSFDFRNTQQYREAMALQASKMEAQLERLQAHKERQAARIYAGRLARNKAAYFKAWLQLVVDSCRCSPGLPRTAVVALAVPVAPLRRYLEAGDRLLGWTGAPAR